MDKESEINVVLNKFKNSHRLDTSRTDAHYSKPNRHNRFHVTKKPFNEKRFRIICVVLGIVLGLGAILGLLFTCLLSFRRDLFYLNKYPASTTKVGGSRQLSIGQLCQYGNQCPANAYCSLTCKCPDTYYFDPSSGSCILAKTYGASCTYDYECNAIVKLICSTTTNTCDCPTNMFWNSVFSGGAGAITGRCEKDRSVGMSYGTNIGTINNIYTGGWWGSQRSIIVCNAYTQMNFNTGRCENRVYSKDCRSSIECDWADTICLNGDGDSSSKCFAQPHKYLYFNYYPTKNDLGQQCNAYVLCNDFKNLKCDSQYTNRNIYGSCVCLNKYYYHNTTMCITGKRYGENCTSLNQCVPASAGFVCQAPYTGATYSVCRCLPTTQYYDPYTETCKSYNSYNSNCNDNTQCSDSYMTGSNTIAFGFCGYAPFGSHMKCLCIYDYYWSGTSCTAKLQNNVACNIALKYPQCVFNNYCDNASGKCICGTGKYLGSDTKCYFLKYGGDSCASNIECWSGACSASSKCN